MTQTPEQKAGIVRGLIRRGELDDYLSNISLNVLTRKRVLASQLSSEAEVGDTIIISDNVKPKLLAGIRCSVVGFEGRKIKIRLSHHINDKWNPQQLIRILPSHIGQLIKNQMEN